MSEMWDAREFAREWWDTHFIDIAECNGLAEAAYQAGRKREKEEILDTLRMLAEHEGDRKWQAAYKRVLELWVGGANDQR